MAKSQNASDSRDDHGEQDIQPLKYGSDLATDIIRRLGVRYMSINPGASFRGLHDSIVNFRASDSAEGDPELIECTHEEIAVAAAHGYAKASGKVMAVGIHNVVGLQHASMAIFNAWTDRVPMLMIGGGGPMDAELRRPTDWTHTALVQGNLVRDFVKWDDQPSSPIGMVESLIRGYHLTASKPAGPVYVCLDSGIQEKELPEIVTAMRFDMAGASPATAPAPDGLALTMIADLLSGAEFPVLMLGSGGEEPEAFRALHELANRWAIAVVDVGNRLNIATTDPMNLSGETKRALKRADVIVAIDVRDIVGSVSENDRTNRTTVSFLSPDARVFSIGLGDFVARGFSTDYQSLYPCELTVAGDPSTALVELNRLLGRAPERIDGRRAEITAWHERIRLESRGIAEEQWSQSPIAWSSLVEALRVVLADEDFMIANGDGSRSWVRRILDLDEPLQSIGGSSGGGLGYGIGATIGACLAHRGTDKIVVDVQSDGDFMMASGALWTFARYRLPALILMVNNASFYNSEDHAIHLAESRNRDVKRAGIGTQITDPDIDFAKMAESMGVTGIGPVSSSPELVDALRQALVIVKEGRPVLVDARTQAR
ncbi:MAG TPA: thiamine pyrophosphate-dependent enzyme [Acidimicrobiales bacterium]|nr:thiamine pyrophosphate-dependent enzyme [Acidimicrobiales bacterium]